MMEQLVYVNVTVNFLLAKSFNFVIFAYLFFISTFEKHIGTIFGSNGNVEQGEILIKRKELQFSLSFPL